MFQGIVKEIHSLSFRTGVVLVVVGGFVDLAIWRGLIAKDAISGYVAVVSRLFWLVGLGIIAAIALVFILGKLSDLRHLPGRVAARREHTDNLLGNINFLDTEAKALLLVMLYLPQGRLQSRPDYVPMERLYDLNIIEQSNRSSYVIIPGLHGVMKVNSAIYKVKDQVITRLQTDIARDARIDPKDGNAIHAWLERKNAQRYGPNGFY